MKLTKRVIAAISPLMEAQGFRLHGNCFYQVRDNIAFCVEIEKPAGNLYAACYILPLYMPLEGRIFTYGRRIASIPKGKYPAVSQASDSVSIEGWCEEFCGYLLRSVLPLFKKIRSPESLISKGRYFRFRFFPCPKIDFMQLETFTYLYLGKEKEAARKIAQVQKELQKADFLTAAVKARIAEGIEEAAKNVMHRTNTERNAYYQTIIANNMENCF